MLKGDYAYKYRFGAVPRSVKRLVVTREASSSNGSSSRES
jgi:hypothetical protein